MNRASRASLLALAFVASLSGPASANGDGRAGGKILLTNGATAIEGSAGGGVSTWALIAGNGTRNGVGASAHASLIVLPDYGWQSHGVSVGIHDRVELSYARQNLDTRDVGARLGLGRGYVLNQDVFGAKLRLAGDAVYGHPLVPQIAVGVQHKRSLDGPVTAAVGAARSEGTEVYVAATKLFLRHSLLVNATLRRTDANQTGLLGFGAGDGRAHALHFEGTVGYQFARGLVAGVEYRAKPDNLGFAREDDWLTAYAAYAISRNLTATAAYADLGAIATAERQRGLFLSLQAAF